LNTTKKYFMIYEENTWLLQGVYDNVEDACRSCGLTVDTWKQSSYSDDHVGHVPFFRQGFVQNLSVWDVLEQMHNHNAEDFSHRGREAIMDHTLNCIAPSLRYAS